LFFVLVLSFVSFFEKVPKRRKCHSLKWSRRKHIAKYFENQLQDQSSITSDLEFREHTNDWSSPRSLLVSQKLSQAIQGLFIGHWGELTNYTGRYEVKTYQDCKEL
jgi:hypothetical protein